MSTSRGRRHKPTESERQGRSVMRRCHGWAIAGITPQGEPIAVGQGFKGTPIEAQRAMALFFAAVASNINMQIEMAQREQTQSAGNGQAEPEPVVEATEEEASDAE